MSSSDMGPIEEFRDEVEPVIFAFGAGITLLFVAVFALAPETAATVVSGANQFVLAHFNWAFLVIMLFFLLFLFFLILGPWGSLRFGDESPEFSFFSYFTMMYSAGLAAGIVFWGPAEALIHYANVPPLYGGVAAESTAAMPIAVQYAVFHWGLTQWACFTVMGLGIGYYVYNYDAPLRVSSVLTPFIGADNIKDSYWAKAIDILAVFATLGGVATSLGFIGSQFLTGLEFQWGIQMGNIGTFGVITGMTVLFTLSLVLGVDKGIRRLSNFNMVLFFVLMVATLIVGPTFFILQTSTDALGGFVSDFVAMSLFIDVANNGSWVNAWTVFYWAWPLAWSPFAGLFIARISRGRSVREVAFTGIGATAMATVPWFLILGSTGVWLQNTGGANLLGPINQYSEAVSGYVLYGALPLGSLLLIGFVVLVTTFFVTSADSSTLAVAMMTTGGKEHPSTIIRAFWGAMLGAVASILMIIGGVDALQSAAIITGGPFAIVGVIAVIGLARSFREQSGNILLQEETVLFGTSRSSKQTDSGTRPEVNDD
ncbi:glycine betaine transporter BetL [Halococcus salifodinae DSM 8989]|uniref:Glycine betaine transporter BetL n=2 Tax=Halococcus salifodinae TaxID=36738 RepID=M0N6F2_9EURY|nr:BCCT family transporter [Halococcus salifodinae]EMA53446.1 glycine betaine transporter BetL [Halococcus salifodinae DSM 8989]